MVKSAHRLECWVVEWAESASRQLYLSVVFLGVTSFTDLECWVVNLNFGLGMLSVGRTLV
jgi:hypothetical protein